MPPLASPATGSRARGSIRLRGEPRQIVVQGPEGLRYRQRMWQSKRGAHVPLYN